MSDGVAPGGAASQRRRLALLAVLAVAGERGVSRDQLLALLWPETDGDSARSALKQAVYALRRDLASDGVITGVNDLRLDPAVISVDLWDFERAAAEGRPGEAAALYRGPFLDGVHISESEEFDPWADSVRARLETRYLAVLEQLARHCEEGGDPAGAVSAWRRLAERQPLDSRPALALARALASARDRGGALNLLRAHQQRIRDELGIEPDAAVAGAIAELRSPRTSGPTVPVPDAEPDATVPAAAIVPAAAARPPRRWRRGSLVAALVVALAAVISGAMRARANGARLSASRIAVLPFHYRGDTAFAYLGEGIMSVLSSTIDGVGALRAADPQAVLAAGRSAGGGDAAEQVADALNAEWTVTGDIVEAGGRLRLSARLTQHVGARRQLSASAEGPPRDFLQMVDRIAADLAGGLGQSGDVNLTRSAASTTASYAALREFLLGESFMRSGRYAGAAEHYLAAVGQDSNFAAAWYRLSVAADWAVLDTVLVNAVHHAARLADRLPLRDRTLIEGVSAWRSGDPAESERLVRIVTAAYPDDPAAWYNLGEVLFHGNVYQGHPIEEARDPFTRVVALDSVNVEAMRHLARLAAREGRREEALQWLDRALARTDTSGQLEMRVFRAIVADGPRGVDAVRGALATADPYQAYVAAYRAQTFARDYDAADSLFAMVAASSAARATRAGAWTWRADMAMARGRLRQALAFADSVSTASPFDELAIRARLLSLPFVPVDTADLTGLHRRLDQERAGAPPDTASEWWGEYAPLSLPFLQGLLDARRGDLAEAGRHLGVLQADRASPARSRAMAEVLRAVVAFERRRWSDVLDATGSKTQFALLSVGLREPEYLSSLARYLRCVALLRLGRFDEASRWLGAMENMYQDVVFEGPVLLAQADLLDRRGEAAAARGARRRFLSLWSQADPPFLSLLDEARRGLTAPAGRR